MNAKVVFYLYALIMHYHGNQIVRAVRLVCSKVARFIDKDTQDFLSHVAQILCIKKAGKFPAVGGPGSFDQPKL